MGRAGARVGAGKQSGWPAKVADGLEGWLGFKNTVGTIAGMASQAAKDGAKRAFEAVQKR